MLKPEVIKRARQLLVDLDNLAGDLDNEVVSLEGTRHHTQEGEPWRNLAAALEQAGSTIEDALIKFRGV